MALTSVIIFQTTGDARRCAALGMRKAGDANIAIEARANRVTIAKAARSHRAKHCIAQLMAAPKASSASWRNIDISSPILRHRRHGVKRPYRRHAGVKRFRAPRRLMAASTSRLRMARWHSSLTSGPNNDFMAKNRGNQCR